MENLIEPGDRSQSVHTLFTIFSQSNLEDELQSPSNQNTTSQNVDKWTKKSVSCEMGNFDQNQIDQEIQSKSEGQIVARKEYLFRKYSRFTSKKQIQSKCNPQKHLAGNQAEEAKTNDSVEYQQQLQQNRYINEMLELQKSRREFQLIKDKIYQSQDKNKKENQLSWENSQKLNSNILLIEQKEKEIQEKIKDIQLQLIKVNQQQTQKQNQNIL